MASSPWSAGVLAGLPRIVRPSGTAGASGPTARATGRIRERLARTRARVVPPVETPPAEVVPARDDAPHPAGSRAERIALLRARLNRGRRDWRSGPPPETPAPPPPRGSRGRVDRWAASAPGPPFERHEAVVPLSGRWGPTTLAGLARPSAALTARLRTRADEAGVDFSRTLFVDTETSGLAGGTGTFAFLIGIGHLDGDGFRVVQFLLRSPAGERAMLERLAKTVRAVGGDRPHLVTYNGASFDLPLLDTRFAMTRVENPFRGGPHLDLLPPARRLFLPGHGGARLMQLERSLLGVERDDDIPGHQIPQVFFEFLRLGRHPRMTSVVAHNRADIISLAALALLASERMEAGWDTDEPVDLFAAGCHMEHRQEAEAAAAFFERALACGLGGAWRDDCLLRLGVAVKRGGDWKRAARLWSRIEPADSRVWLDALVWLAKWEEHHLKRPGRALLHVEDALERLPRVDLSEGRSTRCYEELAHRRSRLTRSPAPP